MDFKNPPGDVNFEKPQTMNQEEARKEIEDLRAGIEYHDYSYYVKNAPKISDALYDKLFHRLVQLEDTFPELKSENSPTQRVGVAPVSKLKKVNHAAPLLSLNAALEKKEVKGFFDFVHQEIDQNNISFVLEPKFDGFSVELVYERGLLKYGATRGNGEEGEDITRNLKTIRTVPLQLQKQNDTPDFLSIRGEVFMSKKGFQQLNKKRLEKGEEPFANPRNAAAGTMRQLDPKKVENKPLDIRFYDILQLKNNNNTSLGEENTSHWEDLKRFSKWGFKTDPLNRKVSAFKEINAYYDNLLEQRETLGYEIDGLVIKLDNYEYRKKLGVRHRSPRWAFAWKFPPKKEITTLEDIIVTVGRTGMLTPVALLAPVNVGGVTVSRATLHNEDEVKNKDVRAGDKVRIARAGDVIPEVVERIKEPGRKREKEFSMPDKCPVCGADVYKEGAYYFCSGQLKCPSQLTGGLVHYASREALNIEGLGEKTAADMVEKDMVKDVSDLYQLKKQQLLKLEGFAEKSANQLYQAIQETKNPEFSRFLYALGIRYVGQRMAEILANHFLKLENIKKADFKKIEAIPEIGPAIAKAVVQFFQQKENQKVLKKLAHAGIQVKEMKKGQEPQRLKGKTFVFTGKLPDYTREDAQHLVEKLGGRATSQVSRETDYLVAGKDPGSKYDQAKDQNIPIIDEKEFQKLIAS